MLLVGESSRPPRQARKCRGIAKNIVELFKIVVGFCAPGVVVGTLFLIYEEKVGGICVGDGTTLPLSCCPGILAEQFFGSLAICGMRGFETVKPTEKTKASIFANASLPTVSLFVEPDSLEA